MIPLFLLVHFPARRLNTKEERKERNRGERRRVGDSGERIEDKEKGISKAKNDAEMISKEAEKRGKKTR